MFLLDLLFLILFTILIVNIDREFVSMFKEIFENKEVFFVEGIDYLLIGFMLLFFLTTNMFYILVIKLLFLR